MGSELDFKHRVVFKKSALKSSGKKAKKKVYKAAGEAKIENADRKRKLTDQQVIMARVFPHAGVSYWCKEFGVSRQTLTRAVKGETFKHLNAAHKPWK